MTQTYSGAHIKSEPQYGDNAEQRAWDNWLTKLAEYINARPASRFIWRVIPFMQEEREFDRDDVAYVVYGRVIEVIGPGDLPHLDRSKKFEDSFVIHGIGLTEVKL